MDVKNTSERNQFTLSYAIFTFINDFPYLRNTLSLNPVDIDDEDRVLVIEKEKSLRSTKE